MSIRGTILIIHAHEDRAWCERLAKHLSARGFDTEAWDDGEAIESPSRTQQFMESIERFSAIVVIISRHHFSSKPFRTYDLQTLLHVARRNDVLCLSFVLDQSAFWDLDLIPTNRRYQSLNNLSPQEQENALRYATKIIVQKDLGRVRADHVAATMPDESISVAYASPSVVIDAPIGINWGGGLAVYYIMP